MSNDTVMIRLQKDTCGRDFNLESVTIQKPLTKALENKISPYSTGDHLYIGRLSEGQ